MQQAFEVVETPKTLRVRGGGLLFNALNALDEAGSGHSVKIPLSEIKLASARSNVSTLANRRGYSVATAVREGHLYITKKA